MAEGITDCVEIDVELLTSSLEGSIKSGDDLSRSSKCCIFKTPSILLRKNEQAYLPDAFSFGPFHYKNEKLKVTEKIKLRYLKDLTGRLRCLTLRDLINEIKVVEKEARQCYAESIYDHLKPEEFLKILVIDGCFIIELFRKYQDEKLIEDDDPVFSMSCMFQFLWHDLILLENQIPWLVLDILFDRTRFTTSNEMNLDQLALNFFVNIFTSSPPTINLPKHKSKHILDLLRNWLIDSPKEEKDSPKEEQDSPNEENCFSKPNHILNPLRNWLICPWKIREVNGNHQPLPFAARIDKPLPSATRLEEAGIKFKKNSSSNILDVKFDNGELQIPPILIQETTEIIFRNLISFEQCYQNCESKIASYAKLMDDLIDTAKDVEIFCNNKIVESWIGLDDASHFFNKLYIDTCFDEFYYYDLYDKVHKYYTRRWPRWRASLIRNYFTKPWAIVSALFAIIILFLTVLQTVYSIKK